MAGLPRLCVVVALLLIAISGWRVRAAEVECDASYDGHVIPEDAAQKVWPSGFRPVAGMCSFGYLHGMIRKGDYEKVRDFYRANHRLLIGFSVQSTGGDVDEAINIGRLFRKYLITAISPHNTIPPSDVFILHRYLFTGEGAGILCNRDAECVCASSCALIWFGAVDRQGTVGLHRPRIEDPAFAALAPSAAAKVYKQVLDNMARYLDEMEAPRPMIDAMVATGSSEIRWITADADGIERPPSFAEWADASCGRFTAHEHKTMIDLGAKRYMSEKLTTDETLLLELLSAKDDQRNRCMGALRSTRVDQLPSP
jgi:hypothetical protein